MSQRRYLLVVLFFAAVVASYGLVESSLFSLTEVQVLGAETLDPNLLRQMTGLFPGENLLTVDLARVEARLREEPRLGAVRVERVWPDRVIVRVTERRPVALVAWEGAWLAADPGGVLFPAEAAWVGRMPILTGVDPGEGRPGSVLEDPGPRLLGLLTGPGASIFQRISELHLGEEGDLLLFLRDPARVRLGDLASAESRFPVLLAVLRDLDARGSQPEEIDLRFDSPVIRPR